LKKKGVEKRKRNHAACFLRRKRGDLFKRL